MKPGYKPPVKKKYFHTKRKLDKKDVNYLKKNIDSINKKKLKRLQHNNEKKENIY